MYVNWRALVVVVILAVAGYFAYQKFWAGSKKRTKMTVAQLLAGYENETVIDQQMTYSELKGRVEKTGKLDTGSLRTYLRKKEGAPETYKLACEMLGRVNDRRSVTSLLKDLAHAKPHVRIGASIYFQHAPARRAFEPHLKNLKHVSPDVRKEAVRALEGLAALTTTGVRYKGDVTKWKEWWDALSNAEKNKIPE